MLPQSQIRSRRNSSKVNLLISFAFHTAIVVALVFFAAREGFLGKQLRKIAVEMVKEKPPEKPKEPEKPKDEPPKPEPPKMVEAPKVEAPRESAPAQPAAAPGNAIAAPPAVAPPSSDVPAFEFAGGKSVQTSSDPDLLYKGFVEYALRAKWARPDGIADDYYVAEIEVSVDPSGAISNPLWKKSSGNRRWDDSVRAAIAATKTLERRPPTNFPERVVVRFDVQDATEPVMP